MTKFLAIDYGLSRSGLSISDPEKIFAFPMETVETKKLINRLTGLIESENISRIIIKKKKRLSGQDSEIESHILKFIESISNIFDKKQIFRYDERFTSKISSNIILNSGLTKKNRRDKSIIDKISASLILESYLIQKNK